jgi:glutamyl-tRNA synthetase/glutamyl-Q tRNA(Asp) synthetase
LNAPSAGPVVTRFAPAPTGHLHLGHVVNAICVWALAGPRGRVLLRIEDHDRQRSRPAFEASILEDLAWLGFVPAQPAVTRQSERGAVYEAALDGLRRRGLVYACACSRAGIAAAGGPAAGETRYPGTCAARGLDERAGLGLRVRLEPSVERFVDWRLGPQEQRPNEQCGDLLVRDREGQWTYQFGVVVDDWSQGVTLVVRGEDLLASTGRQLQLARLIGRPEPPAFLHHPLLMKSPAQKLSKSDGDTGVRDLRTRGWSAEQVIGHAAWQVGLIDAVRPLGVRELPEIVTLAWDLNRATASGAAADSGCP